jgi:hypothetical protein
VTYSRVDRWLIQQLSRFAQVLFSGFLHYLDERQAQIADAPLNQPTLSHFQAEGGYGNYLCLIAATAEVLHAGMLCSSSNMSMTSFENSTYSSHMNPIIRK